MPISLFKVKLSLSTLPPVIRFGESKSMSEKVLDSGQIGHRGVVALEIRQDILDTSVMAELPLVDQLGCGRDREALGERTNSINRARV
ncbi:hypothetical protein QQS21_001396 [Conoideocrella luteorostrata]|uniref:Uncharacterized protein n=1 Tax=Conoideocrella luteorostrata TaxID=1105319 RepID=A0AAJ0CX67_9HYPO|nr:hypothetical protein QQS21_001396 [Conoideocrella luteorostrata]